MDIIERYAECNKGRTWLALKFVKEISGGYLSRCLRTVKARETHFPLFTIQRAYLDWLLVILISMSCSSGLLPINSVAVDMKQEKSLKKV
jgi:hypothetical protein